MSKYVKISLFIIVVAGAVVYFAAKGFSSFIAATKPKENVSGPTVTYLSSTKSPETVASVRTTTASVAPAKIISYAPVASKPILASQDNLGYSIPSGYTRAEISPFYQKVRIFSVSPSLYSNYPSQIRLYSYFTKTSERIDVTGWKIKSNKNEVTIPQAANLYDLLGFSVDSDIIFGPNSYIDVYSNSSAVNRNLRLNKCSGYLENDFSFVPSLPRSCPLITRPEISNLSGQCQSYIMSLNSCQIPSVSVYNSFPGGDDGNKCRAFLGNLNYASCVKENRNDADFYLNDWKVWVGKNILDAQHDTVKLFDSAGLLVDQHIY